MANTDTNLLENKFSPKNNKVKYIFFIGTVILMAAVMIFVFKNDILKVTSNSNSSKENVNNDKLKIVQTDISTSFHEISELRVLTNDNQYYIYDKDTKDFIKEDLPFHAQNYANSFYLATNGDIYLNYENVKYTSPVKFDEKYVKLYSNITEMSINEFGCALFIDKNKNVLAYNMIAADHNEKVCAFDKRYDFKQIVSHVKHVITAFNFNGYLDENDTLYGKLAT